MTALITNEQANPIGADTALKQREDFLFAGEGFKQFSQTFHVSQIHATHQVGLA